MNYTIYQIKNIYTGSAYIGLTSNFNRRVIAHKSKLKSKSHDCIDMQIDYNTFGYKSFSYSIVDNLENISKPDALLFEKKHIEKLDKPYNVTHTSNYNFTSKKGKLLLRLIKKSQYNVDRFFKHLGVPSDKINDIINDPSQLTIKQAEIASTCLSVSLPAFLKGFSHWHSKTASSRLNRSLCNPLKRSPRNLFSLIINN